MGLFTCCISATPDIPQHHGLSKEQLKALYERCIASNSGRLIVHGVFARADTKNNNKRVYPKHVLKREVKRFKYACIQTGTAVGELDHPSYSSQYFRHLNLGNASHQVLDIKWKDGMAYGTIEILPTPSGLLLWELYSQGIKLGVSSRGWASLKSSSPDGTMLVDDDFELITFDFVNDPSTTDAYLLPLAKRYHAHVPDQTRILQLAHLGYGSVLMRDIVLLPSAAQLVSAIKNLRQQHVKSQKQASSKRAGGALTAPAAAVVYGPGPVADASEAPMLSGLEHMQLSSHYTVHEEPFLAPEGPARQFKMHLAMFTTKAHLADIKTHRSSTGSSWQPSPRQQVHAAQEQQQDQMAGMVAADTAAGSAPSAAAASTAASTAAPATAAAGPPALADADQSSTGRTCASQPSSAAPTPLPVPVSTLRRYSSSSQAPDTGSPVTDHQPQELQWGPEHTRSLRSIKLPDGMQLPAPAASPSASPSPVPRADSHVADMEAAGRSTPAASTTAASAAAPAGSVATAPPTPAAAQAGSSVAASGAGRAGPAGKQHAAGDAAAGAQQQADPDVQLGLHQARQTLNAFAAQYSKYQSEMRRALKLGPAESATSRAASAQ